MYTNIPKPTGTTYTDINVLIHTYDDFQLTYDSALDFYDGVNTQGYVNIPKPTLTTYTNIAKPT